MELVRDRRSVDIEQWRGVICRAYYFVLGAASIALVALLPPHFDLQLSVVIPVALVALFLIATEWPTKTAGTFVGTLTSIVVASVVVFGWWSVVLAAIGWAAIQLRIPHQFLPLYRVVVALVGQLGIAVISTYAALGTWNLFAQLLPGSSPAIAVVLRLAGILVAGIVWQTANNFFAFVAIGIMGRSLAFGQLMRTGLVASIYAYLLVALYSFGGLVAAGLFYIVVAQSKLVQDVLGVTVQLQRLERARSQSKELIRELVRLCNIDHVNFASEVQNIAQMIARNLGMSTKEVNLLGYAAELHEIGKSQLPPHVRKNSLLNPTEIKLYKTYPRAGAIMIREADALLPPEIADWIEFAGEHYDGSGNPRGLTGEKIPLQSRILAVAREYVRLLTGHDGAETMTKERAIDQLQEHGGTLYDPKLVGLLARLVKL